MFSKVECQTYPLASSFFLQVAAPGWLNPSQNVEHRRVGVLLDEIAHLVVVPFRRNILFRKTVESSTVSLAPMAKLQSTLLRWPLTRDISRFLIPWFLITCHVNFVGLAVHVSFAWIISCQSVEQICQLLPCPLPCCDRCWCLHRDVSRQASPNLGSACL